MEDERPQGPADPSAPAMPPVLTRLAAVVDLTALEQNIATWHKMRAALTAHSLEPLQEGIDNYTLTIGGKVSKPSLSKVGLEKFLSLFNLFPAHGRQRQAYGAVGASKWHDGWDVHREGGAKAVECQHVGSASRAGRSEHHGEGESNERSEVLHDATPFLGCGAHGDDEGTQRGKRPHAVQSGSIPLPGTAASGSGGSAR